LVCVEDSLWRPPPLEVPAPDARIPQARTSGERGGEAGESGRRVTALDGMRALAITAVLLYHGGFSWAQGGFLGVDVFFVLSGFLITGLLALEHARTGRIRLRTFYLRRARRLLPALYTVLAGVCGYVILVLPQEAAALRGDVGAALGYVTNWWLIVQHQSYFGGTGRPSLLINLWSLAVEEQFYLLWPPVLYLLLRLGRPRRSDGTRSAWPAFVGCIALAAASAARMKSLYSPWSDPSRIYYGTDTRAFELFIGATLALGAAALSPGAAPMSSRSASRLRTAVRDVLGLCALAALVVAVIVVPASAPWLYPGGLLGVCVAAVLLVRAATAGGVVAKTLSLRPLVWLGERSYSLYLWHWPVFDVTRPGSDLALPTAEDFALRLVVSLLLAHLTFVLIERPIRRGALGRLFGRRRDARRMRRFVRATVAVTASMVLVAGAGGLGYAVEAAAARYPSNPDAIAVGPGPDLTLAVPTATNSPGKPSPSASPTVSASAAAVETTTAIPTVMPPPPAHPPLVAFVGDSQPMTLLLNKPSNTGLYLDTIDDSTEGCDFLGGDISSRDGERRDLDDGCANTTQTWADSVAAQHPAIVVLMVGGWDEFNDEVDGVTLTFGSSAWDAYYTARLGTAMTLLRATGVPRIEVALLPCYRPIPEPGSGYWPERGDDWRTRHVNTLLTAYVQAHAGAGSGTLETLQPPSAFCTDPAIAANTDYRWDGLHYYKPGSALYFQTIIPQLLAPND
jgi:peptidoglycan/LPS O-acetylase OafA/YrhL